MTNAQPLRNSWSLILFSMVFVLAIAASPAGQAQTFSVIHNFTFATDGGGFPTAGVTLHGGALYGTSMGGRGGSVYALTKSGSGWTETILSPLSLGGIEPQARAFFGSDGHLYGTTRINYNNDNGRIFRLTPPATNCSTLTCYWREEAVHLFTNHPDGAQPFYGDLVSDQLGHIYGTTATGGDNGTGTVYQLTPAGNGWTETPIFSFPGFEGGADPYAGVIFDDNGNIFGTAHEGGNGWGIVYELTYVNGVGWTETVLHTFQSSEDGENPAGGLVRDSAGNLYGSASDAGFGGGGTIFELSPSGNTWTFKVLAALQGGVECGPWANLTLDAAGNLYGTTKCDGTHQFGNVFKLTNLGDHWQYTSLHDFTAGADGGRPISNVTIDSDGTLYGTTQNGGSEGQGVVWMIKP